MPARPFFRWNAKAGQYVRANGRFVPRKEIRDAIDYALAKEQQRAQSLADDLRAGRISLDAWRTEMRDLVKTVNVYSVVAARGGWAQMTSEDFGRAGAAIRREYGFLEAFAEKLATGAMALDGHVALFAKQYALAGRATYVSSERVTMTRAGYKYESNVLHSGDSCPGCLIATGMGRVPVGQLPAIGSRDCRRNCRCTLAYHKELTDEE